MTRLFGIHSEPDESIGGRDFVTVWSGVFMSNFEGQGYATHGVSTMTVVLEYDGPVAVTLPEGVTFPRTDENYTAIDSAINEALNAHLAKPSIPDLPPGDDGRPTEHPDPAAPGADDI